MIVRDRAADFVAAARAVLELPGGCPVGWQRQRLPADAISMLDELPPRDEEVLGWVTDANVCIWYFPVVARRTLSEIWSGVPGNWIALNGKRWTLTHWKPLALRDALLAEAGT